jgi:hypothetical protein
MHKLNDNELGKNITILKQRGLKSVLIYEGKRRL